MPHEPTPILPDRPEDPAPLLEDDTEDRRVNVLDRVMIAIVAVSLAGSCLLISAAQGTKQGYESWRPNSLLKIVTDLLNFNFQYPTLRGVEVKWLVHGLGAVAVILALCIAFYQRSKKRAQEEGWQYRPPVQQPLFKRWSALTPLAAAMLSLAAYTVWSMLSALWSPYASGSLYEGLWRLFYLAWALGLGLTLTRRGGRQATIFMVIVLVVTAAMGIWYRYERSPELRLEFPIGNPLFLAACLIPGMLLSMGWVGQSLGVLIYGKNSGEQGGGDNAGKAVLRLIGGLLCLAVIGWAFWMTDSRGPTIGLVAGILVGVYLAASQRVRWVMLTLVILVAIFGSSWIHRQMNIDDMNRGATIRFRLYTWNYAGNMITQRPITGCGQGSYILYAQQLARGDVESDPQAFQGQIHAHAHNEWLQTIAELGAAGFAMMACALGLTLWSAILAMRGGMSRKNQWVLIALFAALFALIIEETFNVGLRKPGLPIFFYTIIGLIWAMCRKDALLDRGVVMADSKLSRSLVLVGGIVVGLVLSGMAWRDWQGALAHTAIGEAAETSDWPTALQQAEFASEHRFQLEDRLRAKAYETSVAMQAAAYQLEQTGQMVQRLGTEQRPSPRVMTLADEDRARFMEYFERCTATGEWMWGHVPYYPQIAGWVGQCWLSRQQMELFMQRLGLLEQPLSYVEQARQWIQLEFARNRRNAEVAYLLYRLSGGQPVNERVGIVMIPMRAGPIYPWMEQAVAEMARIPGFTEYMTQMEGVAQVALEQEDVTDWPSFYAPEMFRFAALYGKQVGDFWRAAAQAEKAVTLSEKIINRFPEAPYYAKFDRAQYLFLAQPTAPQEAIDLAGELIEHWPATPNRERIVEAVRHNLLIFQLAAGQEEAVRETLAQRMAATTQPTDEMVQATVGPLYSELCETLIDFPPAQRGDKFDQWLSRAIELNPQSLPLRIYEVQRAFEQGRDAAGVQLLERINQALEQPQQMAQVLQMLGRRFPRNYALQAYADQWFRSVQPPTTASAPAGDMQ